MREPLHPFGHDELHERRVLGHLPSADSGYVHFDRGDISDLERISDDHSSH